MEALAIVVCVLLAFNGYLLVRNYFVGKFRKEIIELCYRHNLRRLDESLFYDSANKWFYEKYSYDRMLLSFKPLKLEYWYTKEEIERLMS